MADFEIAQGGSGCGVVNATGIAANGAAVKNQSSIPLVANRKAAAVVEQTYIVQRDNRSIIGNAAALIVFNRAIGQCKTTLRLYAASERTVVADRGIVHRQLGLAGKEKATAFVARTWVAILHNQTIDADFGAVQNVKDTVTGVAVNRNFANLAGIGWGNGERRSDIKVTALRGIFACAGNAECECRGQGEVCIEEDDVDAAACVTATHCTVAVGCNDCLA